MSLLPRIGKLFIVAIGAATAFSWVVSVQARTGGIAEGPAPDLFLLYTGDVIGHIEPCG